jgi:Peptidase family M1 domain
MAPPTTPVGSGRATRRFRPPRRLLGRVWLASSVVVILCRAAGAAPQVPATPPARDSIAIFIERLEQRAAAGDADGLRAFAVPDSTGVAEFASAVTTPKPSRLVMRERDRRPLGERGQRLIVEVFHERDIEGRLGTWQLDIMPMAASGDTWGIAAATRFSLVNGLYRLSLNATKEYEVRNLTVRAPDLSLEMSSGMAYVADTPEGPTAVVLIGRGVMRFAPPDLAERTQLRIFSGTETLAAEYTAAFIRVRPSDFEATFGTEALQPRSPSAANLRQATEIFETYVGRTLQINLSYLSRDRWSLTPPAGDVIAEVQTRKLGNLTYARSGNDAEDIALFDRKRHRNICEYASGEKLSRRGRFYSEEDQAEYDVLAYDIDVEFAPDRALVEGSARIKVRVKTAAAASLSFRLAESLDVRGVYAPDYGALLYLRVVGQNSLIVNLPGLVARDTEMWLDVVYKGRLPAQTFDREAVAVAPDLADEQQESRVQDAPLPLEPRYLYSNRSYWYPQSVVTDYATAKLRITVPAEYDVVATGDPAGPPAPPPGVAGPKPRKMFVFDAAQPSRYLACLITRLNPVNTRRVAIARRDEGSRQPAADGSTSVHDVSLTVAANPMQVSRVRGTLDEAAAIFQFYGSIIGDAPYPSFTLAMTESDRPGGHSPPYFAVVNQVVANSTFVYRNDPVSFENYPTFFLAHEIAHQWWGHAIGWKNYHEQWISEGFAQYFAALYAEKSRGAPTFTGILRQMRRTAITYSPEGPVYLGYRLGHIRGEDRVFRAVVYNKGAMVLHMLRRLVGDRPFYDGIRSFYAEWRFKKAGSDDFRQAMEKATGRDLGRFFETWVYGSAIPRVKFGYQLTSDGARLRFEQRGEPIDIPVMVTIGYLSGESEDVLVTLDGAVTERTIALKAPIRSITPNADDGALVEIDRATRSDQGFFAPASGR